MSEKPSGWNPETLFLHFEARLEALHQKHETLREADQQALRAALEQSDHRHNSTNEWRQTYGSLVGQMLTRKEALTFIAGVIASAAAAAVIYNALGM